jgi:hypothetical protein
MTKGYALGVWRKRPYRACASGLAMKGAIIG